MSTKLLRNIVSIIVYGYLLAVGIYYNSKGAIGFAIFLIVFSLVIEFLKRQKPKTKEPTNT